MRHHHQAPAGVDFGRHHRVPERQHARHRVLQAFGQRHLVGLQARVARVAALAARIIQRERRRRGVVAAAPDQHLLVAVLLGRFGLVQALQRAVVALVQAPVLHRGQPQALHLIERQVQGADGAPQHAGAGQVELVTLGLQQAAGLARLLDAGGRQIDIGPAGEAVFQVPGGFTVADQNKLVHGAGKAARKQGRGGQRARQQALILKWRVAVDAQRAARRAFAANTQGHSTWIF